MKKRISLFLTLVLMLTTLFSTTASAATEWKTGNIAGYGQSCGYTRVYLTANKTAQIKVYAYNANGKEVKTTKSLEITITDASGNKIRTETRKSGDTISLNNSYKSYRIYVRKTFAESYRPDNALNKNKIIKTWAIKTTSNATFNYDYSYQKKLDDEKEANKPFPYPGMTYFITPKHAPNSVIDTYGGNSSKSEDSNIVLWNYGGGNYKSRVFEFVSVGGGWYKIVNANNGLVLDVNCSNKNVALFKYHGGANQQWKLEDAGNGYYYIRTRVTDKNNTAYYLDVHGAYTSNGTNVEVCDLNRGNNQKFKLQIAVLGPNS